MSDPYLVRSGAVGARLTIAPSLDSTMPAARFRALSRRHAAFVAPRLLAAFGAWALSFSLMMLAALAAGFPPLALDSYIRLDSGHYLAIAVEGYEFLSCRGIPGYDPAFWCGNAGWFPGYPYLINALSPLIADERLAGFILANGFMLGSCYLLRRLLDDLGVAADRILPLMGLAAVFPGGMYYHALFPISLFTFAALLAIRCLARRHYLGATLAAGCGAFFYSTGFLLCLVVGFGVLVTSGDWPWWRRLLAGLLYGAIAAGGLGAVLLLHQLTLGHWDAFFLTQAKYGHGMHNPLLAVARLWVELERFGGNPDSLVAPAQSLLIGLVVLVALAWLLRRWQQAGALEWIVAGQVALFWIFPVTMGPAVSLTRAEANLLPMVALLAPLPRAGQLLLLVAFSILRFMGGMAFFRSALV